MTKRNPLCIIKGCDNRGKKKMRLDIGPTLGDSIVPDEERIKTVMVCSTHHRLLSERYLAGLTQGVSEGHTNN